MIYKTTIIYWLTTCFLILFFFQAKSQSTKKISISGNAGLNIEWYDLQSRDSTITFRRPSFNYRFFINPTINIGDNISIPFNIMLSKQQRNILLPQPPRENLFDYVTDLSNNIGISPKIGWAEFHLGTHTVDFSELSTGNIPLFGAGIDLQPGIFRIAASYGITNWGFEYDSFNNVLGAFRQQFQAIKIGIGKKDKSGLYLNAVKLSDNISKDADTLFNDIRPVEGVLLSSNFKLFLSSQFNIEGEVGTTVFSTDKLQDKINYEKNVFTDIASKFIPIRYSTKKDYAGKASINYNAKNVGLSIQGKYIGAGYEALGYSFMQTDIFDITLTPRLQFFKNKLILNGSIGYRFDNLSNTKLAASTSIIAVGNLIMNFSKNFYISANYSNFGIENNIDNDTLKINFISENYSITPGVKFKTINIQHNISLNYNRNNFDDLNLITGNENQNNSTTYSGTYAIQVNKFSFTLNTSFLKNIQKFRTIELLNSGITIGYRIKKSRLRVSNSFIFSRTLIDNHTPDFQFLARPNLSWGISKKLNLNLRGSINFYRYGSVRMNTEFNEQYIQTGITQQF